MAGTVWERFAQDPRSKANAQLRASNADRDVVNDVLGTAYAEGRITPQELDERSDRVTQSKTLAELPPIIDDLVSTSGAALTPVSSGELREEAEHRYRVARQNAFFSFIAPTLICWVIWAGVLIGNSGTWFPWPLFVTIGTGTHFFRLVTSREDSIRTYQRQIAKQQTKELEARERRDHERPN